MSVTRLSMNQPVSNFAAPLNDLAVIEITGNDAVSFLHGQLTHDIAGLGQGQARLAGYCTAKGRLLATLLIWHDDNDGAPVLRAMLKADIAAALVKRLTMFILRAKVGITLTKLEVTGVALERHDAASAQSLGAPAIPDDTPAYTTLRHNGATWILAPGATAQNIRWWVVDTAPPAQADPLSRPLWQAADIAAGLPWVEAATQDTFIPQTLNLDLIDGVSFTKGCYPGQEVVARSHYRGTVKRRMAYGVANASPQLAGQNAALAGMDIYNALQPDNPCGRVVNAAIAGDTLAMLLEIQLGDLETAHFRLGSASGSPIEIKPLPYALVA